MQNLIKNQHSFFESNATKDLKFRKAQLNKFYSALKANEEFLYNAIYEDFKKSEFDTYASEISLIYHEIKVAIRKLKKWSKTRRVGTNLLNFPAISFIVPEPLGVSLIIGAWNYPYLLSLSPVVAAMAAGCTIILKPSELPSKTSALMAKIVQENFEPEYFAVVEGGVEETTDLLKHKFDKIFFTGSAPVGRIVYQAAAKNLTPVTLELGGKSPAIVCKSCNLDMTVKRLVWSKFFNAGQTCIAPDYVLVDKEIEQIFLEKVKAEIEKENYSVENQNYVEIINERNVKRLIELIPTEKVYFGGQYDIEKRHVAPTILTGVTFEDKIMRDEIFGPILPVIPYEKIDAAISAIKKLPRPLSCYVFTNKTVQRKKVLQEISFGGGAVNEAVMQIANSKLPFGGVGESGIGNYHGINGFNAFTHYKSILKKPTWFELNLKYYPRTKTKLKLVKWIMKL